MEYICKFNVESYGYIDTKNESVTLEKDKVYTLEKAYGDVQKEYYYNVISDGVLITTISESEKDTFFEEN